MTLTNYIVAALIGIGSCGVSIMLGFDPWQIQYWAISIPLIIVGNLVAVRYL